MINEIRKVGYEVKITHYRVDRKGKYVITYNNNRAKGMYDKPVAKPKGGKTTIEITYNGVVVYQYKVQCHSNDHFSFKIGSKLVVENAYAAFKQHLARIEQSVPIQQESCESKCCGNCKEDVKENPNQIGKDSEILKESVVYGIAGYDEDGNILGYFTENCKVLHDQCFTLTDEKFDTPCMPILYSLYEAPAAFNTYEEAEKFRKSNYEKVVKVSSKVTLDILVELVE